jgi:hypothetical protein
VRAKAFAAIAAATAIAALLAPGTSAARAQPSEHRANPGVVTTFAVHGTNGYTVTAVLRNRHVLTVSAMTVDHPAIVITAYRLDAQQARGSDAIVASLGKLGRIDMRFVRESTREETPLFPRCKGETDKVEEGQFVGTFEFRGERAFTRARATRAPGSVTVEPAPTCNPSNKNGPDKRGPHKRGPAAARALAWSAAHLSATHGKAKVHVVNLKLKTKNPAVEVDASRLSGPDKHGKEFSFDTFVAAATRERGRIEEESAVLVLLAQGPYFKVPDLTRLTSEVVLKPPAPFIGSGTLRRDPSGQLSSTGDLRVNLPGFGVVPLSGTGIQATLCADSGCHAKKE